VIREGYLNESSAPEEIQKQLQGHTGNLKSVADMKVYPNPTSSELTIELENIKDTYSIDLELFSSIGQKVYSSKEMLNNSSFFTKTIDLKLLGLRNGVYILKLSNGSISKVERIVITE
jgi:hypothetical protein